MTTKVTRPMLDAGAREALLVFRIYDPSNQTEPLIINLPYDGSVTSASWQVDTGSFNFNIDVDTTPISWTTAAGTSLAASSTAGEDTAASANAFSAGDALNIDIGTVTGTPNYMQLELLVQIAEVDA